MIYADFEAIMSPSRLGRYLTACGNDTRRCMTLYRRNLQLSQELFTIVSCFEIALRNGVDKIYVAQHGQHWLRDSAQAGGMFDNANCQQTKRIIQRAINDLHPIYSHGKLVAKMDFGFWRYLFAQPQFFAGGQLLLQAFPSKPRSTPAIQYNHTFIFHELEKINDLRNRIAHHEPICFVPGQPVIGTVYARQHYNHILQLFQWMNIDEAALLYGLDHVNAVCNQIDSL
jgi:hypothetical protein